MARFRCILFDLDGTLLDSSACAVRATQEAFAAADLPPPSAEDVIHKMGIPIEVSFVAFMGAACETQLLAAVIYYFRARYRAYSDELVCPFPGVAGLLRDLAAIQVAVAIVSSKKSDVVRHNLAAGGLSGDVAAIVGSDDVANYKPHPEPVEKALAKLGVHGREGVLMVGDAVHDIETALRAGVVPAGVAWGAHTVDALRKAGASVVFGTVDEMRAALVG
jgi:phosphoglycolate phosphatase